MTIQGRKVSLDLQENLFEKQEEPYVNGKIKAVFYQNPSNFYKVLLIQIEDTNLSYKEKEIVITGNFGHMQEEEMYRFFGKIVTHPKYGTQFVAERYNQMKPTSAEGLIAYLSGDKFPGIGQKTAQSIIEVLGEKAIDKITEDSAVLAQVPKLNKKKRDLISDVIQQSDGMEKTIIGLTQYGFGSQLAYSIFQTYKEETLEIIQENPYRLVDDIEHIGFKKADNIAEELGFSPEAPARLKAALLYALNDISLSQGDTYTTAKPLMKRALQLLESSRAYIIEPEVLADQLLKLVEENRLIENDGKLYMKSLYAAEWGLSTSIRRLQSTQESIHYEQEIPKEIDRLEKQLKMTYGASQRKAIEKAVCSPLFILTGGPGTGKTTVLNGIVTLYAELNGLSLNVDDYKEEAFPILLAAPTGRAAKKMNESTGLPSSTIHRLLGLNGQEKPGEEIGEKELEGGLLIVDEMSMVDTWLANQLLKAVPQNMQVLMVGDKDQLPSVGPGQVLHDLLASHTIPSIELNEIYRQGDGSSIISLAHSIKNGELPVDFLKPKKDRSFFNSSAYQIGEVIEQVVKKAKEKGFTPQDIQVLAPMYKGPAGINALNTLLQNIFNPNESGKRKEVRFNDTLYRIGDKVLQLINFPEKNVFNGDMGEIVSIQLAKDNQDKVDQLTIRFDSNEVTYKRNEWNKITLAYCCSIHKSQGSEFKMVILPMVHNYHRMLRRDLLYTAITRSSELLILCGEPTAYQNSVLTSSADRCTTLKERLTDDSNLDHKEDYSSKKIEVNGDTNVEKETKSKKIPKEFKLTVKSIQDDEIDPMIGMKDVTPYQFL